MNQITLGKGIANKIGNNQDAVTTYVALRGVANNAYNSTQFVTLDGLIFLLTGEIDEGVKDWNKYLKKLLKKGLDHLNSIGLIKILKTTKKGWVIDLEEIAYFGGSEKFEAFSMDEINSLFKEHGASGIDYLMRFMCLLDMGSGEYSYHYIRATRETLALNTGIKTVKTLDKYNKFLENMGMIYVHRYKCKFKNSGKTPPCLYSMNTELSISKVNEAVERFMTSDMVEKDEEDDIQLVVTKGFIKKEVKEFNNETERNACAF